MAVSGDGRLHAVRIPDRHGYAVEFSPYKPSTLACATSQNYGISGCGTLVVLEQSEGGIAVRRRQRRVWASALSDDPCFLIRLANIEYNTLLFSHIKRLLIVMCWRSPSSEYLNAWNIMR
uniref:Peroxisomal biogenesis factor 7 n=1 Tax=Xenopus tropicalis TaxID=8364 RepID=A0A803K7M5_XENTR